MNKKGVVLLSHGSRVKGADSNLAKLAKTIESKCEYYPVILATLQFSETGLKHAVSICVEKGVKDIVVVPLLLFAGFHAKHDIPELVNDIVNDYKDVDIKVTQNIGEFPGFIDLINRIIESV